MTWLCRTVVLVLLLGSSSAGSVIGFAASGAVSHQAAFARIGLELVERGHSFAMLVSAGDTLTQARFAKPPFQHLRQIYYSGPPELGTEDWLKSLHRAPLKVYISSDPRASARLDLAPRFFCFCSAILKCTFFQDFATD